MTAASRPCSDRLRRTLAALVVGAICAWVTPAQAHKASDAYLQLDADAQALTLRIDVALRDLDAALDLDTDSDGKLTWSEVKAGWPAIEAYVTARLRVEGCALRPAGQALERRNDGAYAALTLHADCRLAAEPKIGYSLFAEIDPTHRGLARIQVPGQPVRLQVLDPAVAGLGVGSSASESASAPRAASAAAADVGAAHFPFVREGLHHIVTGYDHLLFLLCLMLPAVMRRTPAGWAPVERLSQAVWPVLGIVTAFTLAHSITLALAATGVLTLPSSFIEPAIAATIVLAAIDNVRPLFGGRRGLVTFLFGLIHGFGFAGVLAELALPPGQFAWTLFQFNLGIELGQATIVLALIGLLYLARRDRRYPRWVIGGGSYAAMAMGALWLFERSANFKLLPF